MWQTQLTHPNNGTGRQLPYSTFVVGHFDEATQDKHVEFVTLNGGNKFISFELGQRTRAGVERMVAGGWMYGSRPHPYPCACRGKLGNPPGPQRQRVWAWSLLRRPRRRRAGARVA